MSAFTAKIQAYMPGRKGEKNSSENLEEYPARIRAFIRELDGRNSEALKGDSDTLEKLFRLVRGLQERHATVRKNYLAEEKARKEAEKQRDALMVLVNEKTNDIGNLHARIQDLGIQHSAEINQRQIEHQGIVESLTHNYDATVWSMKEEHKSETDRLKEKYKSETDRLKGQLLVNQDDSKPWPDDKLKIKFNELHVKVDNIAAPSRVRITVPMGHQLPVDLDPTGFLRRVDSTKAHLLIKSSIWRALYDHFFSLPFGFGVLGGVDGQNALIRAYTSWYAVVEGHNSPGEFTKIQVLCYRE
jgi:hypothetical protein